MPENGSYHVSINDEVITIRLDEERIFINDRHVSASFANIGPDAYSILLDNQSFDLIVSSRQGKDFVILVDGEEYELTLKDRRDLLFERFGMEGAASNREHEIKAPMPGLVLNVLVTEGEEVQEGAGLVVLEAMKMENEIRASSSGVIARIHVQSGQAIGKDDVLLELS